MDKETLIKVVAMLDARIERLRFTASSNDIIRISELDALSYHLQKAIDADVAAMESTTGE
jgi:hypothetical protein